MINIVGFHFFPKVAPLAGVIFVEVVNLGVSTIMETPSIEALQVNISQLSSQHLIGTNNLHLANQIFLHQLYLSQL